MDAVSTRNARLAHLGLAEVIEMDGTMAGVGTCASCGRRVALVRRVYCPSCGSSRGLRAEPE